MLEACLFREESRGGHFRDDFPTSSFLAMSYSSSKGKDIHTRPLDKMAVEFKIFKCFVYY